MGPTLPNWVAGWGAPAGLAQVLSPEGASDPQHLRESAWGTRTVSAGPPPPPPPSRSPLPRPRADAEGRLEDGCPAPSPISLRSVAFTPRLRSLGDPCSYVPPTRCLSGEPGGSPVCVSLVLWSMGSFSAARPGPRPRLTSREDCIYLRRVRAEPWCPPRRDMHGAACRQRQCSLPFLAENQSLTVTSRTKRNVTSSYK